VGIVIGEGVRALSPREVEVLMDLCEGYKPAEIAVRQCRSVVTIRSQIQSIYVKLGVNNVQGAVGKAAWAIRSAMIEHIDEASSDCHGVIDSMNGILRQVRNELGGLLDVAPSLSKSEQVQQLQRDFAVDIQNMATRLQSIAVRLAAQA